MATSNDKLFGWGLCEDNQLSSQKEDTRQIPVPRIIPVRLMGRIKSIKCGYKHTLILNDDGEVYSCGCNEYEQLGHRKETSDFCHIDSLSSHPISEIACGAYHNAAISHTGNLYTWGCNLNGQLGREGANFGIKLVRSLHDHRVAQVSIGIEHTVVLTGTSQVFTFGANSAGQLGLGFWSDSPQPTPRPVTCLQGLPVRQVCAGGMHTSLLSISGSMYIWGDNSYGQLGLGDVEVSSSPEFSRGAAKKPNCLAVPTLVRALQRKEVVYVDCGELHTAVLTRQGQVFTFGANQFGQLGLGETAKSVAVPSQITSLPTTADNSTVVVTQVACGRSHTLLLVASTGSVYAFGAGTDGQLGNEEFANNNLPKAVKGPWISATHPTDALKLGSYVVVRICTGGDHSYILACKPSASTRISVPDLREYDPMSPRSICSLCPAVPSQLLSALSAPALPAPSLQDSPLLRTVSFSSVAESGQSSLGANYVGLPYPQTHAMVTRLATVFSSLGCLAASCLSERHFETGREEHGVDLDAAKNLQTEIFNLLTANSLHRLVAILTSDVLRPCQSNYPSIESLRGFMVIAVSSLLNMPNKPKQSKDNSRQTGGSASPTSSADNAITEGRDYYPFQMDGYCHPGTVLSAFASALDKLDPVPSKIIDNWLAKMQPRYLKRLVSNLRNLINFNLISESYVNERVRKSGEECIRNSLDLMKRLHNINESKHRLISYDTFYIPSIPEKINIELSFVNWIRESESRGMRFFSFFDYPFIFDASSKARMLTVEAQMNMSQAFTEAQSRALLQTVFHLGVLDPVVCPFFVLTVRREHLLEDTLSHLTMAEPSSLRKVLRVKFEGEDGVDEGGVLKEFFLLIFRDILSPIYGMFRCYPESRMLWFSELNMESDNVFLLVGILCGLAIYNSIIVDLSFTLAMFRKLLGEEPCLDDLKELDPVVGRSLQQLLDYEGDDFKDVFCLTFSLDIDFFGATRKVELEPHGAIIEVTQSNKHNYVNKYVDYVFNQSCRNAYSAFERGFRQVCFGRALQFFLPMELQSLVVGAEVVDWSELRSNTSYHGVYWDHHQVIEWFWQVLLIEFSVEDKKKFLRFLTGCDRVPVVGFGGLKIVIQPHNSGDDYLPVAHTCANTLDLPLYSSKEVLSRKLSASIQHTEGFGLV